MTEPANNIRPQIGIFDLGMIVVSLVIGIGIFRTPAIVARQAGSEDVFFLAWAAGGLVSLIGALVFAEIGSRHHFPGGFYKLISTAFHPVYSFMINWVIVLTYGAGMAGVALIGSEYINPLLPDALHSRIGIQGTAVITLLFFYMVNMLGIKSGSRIQNLLSSLKIVMMLVLCTGIFFATNHSSEEVIAPVQNGGWLAAFGASLIAVFYTFGGYQQTLNFGADIKNPVKSTPRGILLGMFLIIALYMSINYAYYKVLGFEGLKSSNLIAADTAKALFGSGGEIFFSVAIFLSVLGFINATMLSLPRVYYAMADDRILPGVFKKVNSKTQVQEFALTFLIVTTLLSLLMLDTFEQIVNYVMSVDSIALASSAATLFVFRRKAGNPDLHTGFKMKGYPWLPAFFVLFLCIIAINVIVTDPSSAIVGWGLFLGGAPLYFLLQKLGNRS
ncbi:serine/threonine protein kinase [Dyadobacter luteus]|jgi:APA family basic amino acid/polyamine antiporter|uniref:Serine/threonine protein kinase n=1 Tax=Dyadobacter luteus TaxID=2259619 RepID=A0A3D8Y5A2_9BACT|nr:amino acid permease [Dyadobacter luteus]REA57642.1 serine/threonine protein kinase [Dyadobacter luteus]